MPRFPVLLIGALLAACSAPPEESGGSRAPDTLTVYVAASFAHAMHSAIAGYSARTGAVVLEERGGSVELARRVTELHRVPDLLVLADADVFPTLLVPRAAQWFVTFARDRLVIAYTPTSRYAKEISADNWTRVMTRPGVRVGRADPAVAPVGYRALLLLRLAELAYHDPSITMRVLGNSKPAYMRGDATQLATLLEEGEADYIIDYESVARTRQLKMVKLPESVDLGNPSRAADYAAARVRFRRGGSEVEVQGAAVALAISVPRDARHGASGARLAAFLLGHDGRALLQRDGVDLLEHPLLAGDSVPAVLAPMLQSAVH